VTEGFLRD